MESICIWSAERSIAIGMQLDADKFAAQFHDLGIGERAGLEHAAPGTSRPGEIDEDPLLGDGGIALGLIQRIDEEDGFPGLGPDRLVLELVGKFQ